jgi:hypothetical protein
MYNTTKKTVTKKLKTRKPLRYDILINEHYFSGSGEQVESRIFDTVGVHEFEGIKQQIVNCVGNDLEILI